MFEESKPDLRVPAYIVLRIAYFLLFLYAFLKCRGMDISSFEKCQSGKRSFKYFEFVVKTFF